MEEQTLSSICIHDKAALNDDSGIYRGRHGIQRTKSGPADHPARTVGPEQKHDTNSNQCIDVFRLLSV